MNWKNENNGWFSLWDGETLVCTAYAAAEELQGRKIDTRNAEIVSEEENGNGLILTFRANNGLVLKEILGEVCGVPSAQCILSDVSGALVETNRLEPAVVKGNRTHSLPLIDDLWTKMLLVPYDNDLWNRYQLAAIGYGRESYDVTVFLNEESRQGFLMGAVDFDTWKNAIVCSHEAWPVIHAVSGVADLGTRDILPHGSLIDTEVSSARFVFMYGPDYRTLLENFGAVVREVNPPLEWKEGVPFGFNCYAGLARKLDIPIYEKTSKFLREELLPRSFGNNGLVHMNYDAGWERLDLSERMRVKDDIHNAGQRAGIYGGPFIHSPWVSVDDEIPEVPGSYYRDILVRDKNGEIIPALDGLKSYDVTHPVWKEMMRKRFESYREQGYDYIKIDFLSQGGVEGVRYDKKVRTGRQAILEGYKYIVSLCEMQRQPFFLSYSLAPLFPCGLAHSRRYACDTFGTNKDVEYALNTQTYGWWVNGNLYEFNDPDHLTLLKSFTMSRTSTEGEARARYTTGVISGGLMLLSDDYNDPKAVERALLLATNPEVNAVARSHVAFRPVETNSSSASHVYTAEIDGEIYTALFSWKEGAERLTVDTDRAGIPEGSYRDLWSGKVFTTENGCLTWDSECCNALLLKYVKGE